MYIFEKLVGTATTLVEDNLLKETQSFGAMRRAVSNFLEQVHWIKTIAYEIFKNAMYIGIVYLTARGSWTTMLLVQLGVAWIRAELYRRKPQHHEETAEAIRSAAENVGIGLRSIITLWEGMVHWNPQQILLGAFLSAHCVFISCEFSLLS